MLLKAARTHTHAHTHTRTHVRVCYKCMRAHAYGRSGRKARSVHCESVQSIDSSSQVQRPLGEGTQRRCNEPVSNAGSGWPSHLTFGNLVYTHTAIGLGSSLLFIEYNALLIGSALELVVVRSEDTSVCVCLCVLLCAVKTQLCACLCVCCCAQ